LADIAIEMPGATTVVAATNRALYGHGVVSAYMQPARVLAVPHAVADNDRVCPNMGGPDKEQTFRSGRDPRRNGLSPMIVGR
jgi:hypothetical protein